MTWELVSQDGRRQPVWDGMVGGRGSDADWKVNDGRASRRHAQFIVNADGVFVRDLGSTNGAYVNGLMFRNAVRPLCRGDQLRIGDSVFTLRRGADVAPTGNGGQHHAPAYPPVPPPQPAYPPQQPPALGYPPQPPALAYPPVDPYAAGAGAQGGTEPREWLTTLLLCIFVGSLGIHRFYTGHIGTGILMLLTLGFGGIWWLIDLILIVTNNFKDKEGRPLVRR